MFTLRVSNLYFTSLGNDEVPILEPVGAVVGVGGEVLLPNGGSHGPCHEVAVVSCSVADQVREPQLPGRAGVVLEAVVGTLSLKEQALIL